MPRFSRLIFAGLLFLCACRQDNEIQTYRIAKDSAAPSAPQSKEISWKVPTGWKEQAPSAMRVGSFVVTGENGQTADVSVIPLTGEAGGDLANINRWRGQIQLADLSEEDLSRQRQSIAPNGRSMILIDFANAQKRLVAAIYKQPNRTWFFKMLGDDATVRAAKPAFLEFLNSLHFANEK